MADRIPLLFLEAMGKLQKNPGYVLEQQSADPVDALRCYPRRPEDGRIDWKESVINVLRLINASNKPYAGAYCEFEGEKMIIWDAELSKDAEMFCAIPGQITKIGSEFIEVACSDGKIRINQVQYQGQLVLPSDLIKSNRKLLH